MVLPLTIINYFVVVFTSKDHARKYFRTTAVNLDKFGNREFRTLWNLTLRKENGYEFGNINETISSVLGKNQRNGTLSKCGKVLVWILDTIDKNHCKNSIEEI